MAIQDKEQTMVHPGQRLANPVTGESFKFIETAASSGGELLSFELGLRPGGAVPISHVHPVQTERFEVIAGRMSFRLGRRRVEAGPGEIVEVAPGTPHSFANPGGEEARVLVEVRPALAMEEMFAEVIAMAKSGALNRRGLPRSPAALARLALKYDREAHSPWLGVGAQRLLLAPLVALSDLMAPSGAELRPTNS
jgi:mannose-6-phosphate isomerase-like protein (cupin superfamily)